MNALFKFCYSDKMLFSSLLISIIVFVGLLGFIWIFFQQLPPYLPLYNKLPWGYARIGNKVELLYPVLFALACICGNTLSMRIVYAKNPLLSRLLAATNSAISLFAAIYVIQIIRAII